MDRSGKLPSPLTSCDVISLKLKDGTWLGGYPSSVRKCIGTFCKWGQGGEKEQEREAGLELFLDVEFYQNTKLIECL